MKSKKILAIDIETTGQFMTACGKRKANSMIAFCCVVVDSVTGKELDKFEAYMKEPIGTDREKRCMDEFWNGGNTKDEEEKKKRRELLKTIEGKMEDPRVVMLRYVAWFNKLCLEYGEDLVEVSDNGGYDFAWKDKYVSDYTPRPATYYQLESHNKETDEKEYSWARRVDTDSFYLGVLAERTGKDHIAIWKLAEKVGCKNTMYNNTHDPLEDARNICANYILFHKMKQGKQKRRYNNPYLSSSTVPILVLMLSLFYLFQYMYK